MLSSSYVLRLRDVNSKVVQDDQTFLALMLMPGVKPLELDVVGSRKQ